MWKSREDKLPPASYFSMIVAYLQKAYDDARISRELMEALQPYFVEAWRNGKSAEVAAQTTCSCHKGEVVPSPVVGVRIVKGSVRPPKDAQRGEVFGADALRPPAAVERLGRRMAQLAKEQAKQELVTARWAKRAQSARKESTQREARQKQTASATKHEVMLVEARRIETEIKRLQGDLNRPTRTQRFAPEATVSGPVASGLAAPVRSAVTASVPSAVATPVKSAVTAPVQSTVTAPVKEKAERPARKRAIAAADTANPASTTAPSAQGEAMLRAIEGLMPDLAGRLATEMAKERSAK